MHTNTTSEHSTFMFLVPTTCFGDSIRPSSGRRHKYRNENMCQHYEVICSLFSLKKYVFILSNFIKLTVTQPIVTHMFSTGLYLGGSDNLEKNSKYFIFSFTFFYFFICTVACTAPIVINLIHIGI